MTDLPAECRKHSDELPLPYEVKVTLLDAAARIEKLEAAHKSALDLAERHMNEKHKLQAALREAATSLDQAANEMCDCRKAGTKRVCRGAHYEQAAKDARTALEERT